MACKSLDKNHVKSHVNLFLFFFFASWKAHLSMDDNHSHWHLKYSKWYPTWKMKARINVWCITLLTDIQGHENANKQGCVFPLERLTDMRQNGARWNHSKGIQRLQPLGCFTLWNMCKKNKKCNKGLEHRATATCHSTAVPLANPDVVLAGSKANPSQCPWLERMVPLIEALRVIWKGYSREKMLSL